MTDITNENTLEFLNQLLTSHETRIIQGVRPKAIEFIQDNLVTRIVDENITINSKYYDLPERRVYMIMDNLTDRMLDIIRDQREENFEGKFCILCCDTPENSKEAMEKASEISPVLSILNRLTA